MSDSKGGRADVWDEAEIICANPDNTTYHARSSESGEAALIYYAVIDGSAGASRIEGALHRYRSLAEGARLVPISTGRIGRRTGGGYDVAVYAPPLERFDASRDIGGPGDALRCASALIGAVAALHGAGIVHGNVCEGNLFRDGDGGVLLFGQLFPMSVRREPVPGGGTPEESCTGGDLRALGRTVRAMFAAAARTRDGSPGEVKYMMPMRAEQLLSAVCENPDAFGGADRLKREWDDAFSHIVPYGETAEAYDHLKHYTAAFDPKASMVFAPAEVSRFTTTVLMNARETARRRRSAILDIASVCAVLASAALYVLIRFPALPRYGGPF